MGAAVLASSLAAPAQMPAKVHRIGFLGPGSASGYVREIEAIRGPLRELGYTEGRNVTIEYRWADGDMGRLKPMAAELVGLGVDLLITYSTVGVRAAMQTTK